MFMFSFGLHGKVLVAEVLKIPYFLCSFKKIKSDIW